MLFYNNSEKIGGDIGNILIRMGEGCATNCYNCSSSTDKIKFYGYDMFSDVLHFIKNKCDRKLDIFFYGVEVIKHPEIEKFIRDERISTFNKSLHITPIYNRVDSLKIKYLALKYLNISFDTCYTIKSTESLLGVLKYLRFIINNNIKSTIDLFYDYDKFGEHILNFLNLYSNSISGDKSINTHIGYNKCYEFIINDNQIILLYDLKEQKIENKRVTNLQQTSCIAKESIDIKKNKIYISEEVEFTKDGDITIHLNTYCSKAINKISNINKNNSEILEDFNKLDKYLDKYNKGDMGENCYKCILNEYNY